ncbi:phage tail protein [Clostridium magnum]|uniref:Prophage minor tail protein Z n=1 Tax=Clostridium magnum DSM 2767 TaxID=1121326 RepID=A0A161W0Q6_9CLOT|nr:phage tail protein [Clostridium magnum]KZL88710.1 prophage minor tail protein Z [Clostridium magnum DSM 2767]SHJ44262.1 Prophage minor tail protein Z (GPZ) [Clostridium magnum DSM 2767]
MIGSAITINATKVKEVEKELGQYKTKAPLALSRALNRAAANAKTNASKKAREKYNIKARDVNSTIKIAKASKGSLRAVVKSTGERLPLIKFKVSPPNPRPKKPPKVLRVAVKKGGLKELVGGFVASINGNKVFRRTLKSRLPIEQLFGPAVPQMLGNVSVKEFIEGEAAKVFDKRLDHEIQRIMGGNK